MRGLRGYHIKWAFSAFIVALVAFTIVRQLFLSTPSGKFEAYMSFLENADTIHLYTTTDPWQGTADPDAKLALPAKLSDPDRDMYTEFFARKDATINKNSGGIVADFLRDLRGGTVKLNSGFQPHHFVLATKGDKKIEIDISFQARQLRCTGDLPMLSFSIGRDVTHDRIAEFFGGDTFPQLEQIDKVLRERQP